MCPLTQWAGWLFASHIFSRYHSDLLRINRLNLTLLCSDCPINHNGRLKFPEVKNNQKRFLDNNILIFLFFFFADNLQISFKLLKIKSTLRNLRFFKSKFFLDSETTYEFPFILFNWLLPCFSSTTYVKLQSGRCQKFSNC